MLCRCKGANPGIGTGRAAHLVDETRRRKIKGINTRKSSGLVSAISPTVLSELRRIPSGVDAARLSPLCLSRRTVLADKAVAPTPCFRQSGTPRAFHPQPEQLSPRDAPDLCIVDAHVRRWRLLTVTAVAWCPPCRPREAPPTIPGAEHAVTQFARRPPSCKQWIPTSRSAFCCAPAP